MKKVTDIERYTVIIQPSIACFLFLGIINRILLKEKLEKRA
jgi:hypothetical protein